MLSEIKSIAWAVQNLFPIGGVFFHPVAYWKEEMTPEERFEAGSSESNETQDTAEKDTAEEDTAKTHQLSSTEVIRASNNDSIKMDELYNLLGKSIA